jgi:hypothetical protein
MGAVRGDLMMSFRQIKLVQEPIRASTMLSTRHIHKQKVLHKMSIYIVELVHKEIFLGVVHKQ